MPVGTLPIMDPHSLKLSGPVERRTPLYPRDMGADMATETFSGHQALLENHPATNADVP